MKLLTDQKKSRNLLNITPLIDVLFILIIFFTVSSTFLEQPGIKLAQLMFRDKEITIDNLGPILKDAMAQSLDRTLIINADKNVPHGFVVHIMDIARQNGVAKIVIATEQK
ncbi:MAG: biopolymer transporter ExbD [Calditrichia bacterium]